MFFVRPSCACEVSFADWYKTKVDTKCTFSEYALGIMPMLAIQAEHQQLAQCGVVFEIRAYAYYTARLKQFRKPVISDNVSTVAKAMIELIEL
jgi:hypothetical protein